MKLMHVMAGAGAGGAENIFLEDVIALADAGIGQFVVTRANNPFRLEQLRARNIPVATTSFSSWWRIPTSRVLSRAVAEFDPDIAQYWMGRAGSYARRGRAKNVGWYGGYYDAKRFRNCDYHIGLTQDIVRHIVSQNIPESRTALIHTFAEFKPAAPLPRAELNTPGGAPLLLALARLHWKKGLDVLLRALAQNPSAWLWIAGDGPDRAKLETLTDSLSLRERVRFLGWRNDRERLLAACDICVFPSRYEPFGTVMVDAWAAGRPLIAAAAQGPRAYVEDGVNGLLVPVDDVTAFSSAIARAVADKDLRTRLAEGGRRTYERRFTKVAFLRDSLAFYRRILGESP